MRVLRTRRFFSFCGTVAHAAQPVSVFCRFVGELHRAKRSQRCSCAYYGRKSIPLRNSSLRRACRDIDRVRSFSDLWIPDPDILVSNAGGPLPDFRRFEREDWIKALDGNMLAPMALCLSWRK